MRVHFILVNVSEQRHQKRKRPWRRKHQRENNILFGSLSVRVAVSSNTGPFFVEDEEDPTRSFIVHVQGASGTFRYEQRRSDAQASSTMLEAIQGGHVHQDNLSLLRQTARRARIRNDDPTWNCPEFVWTVLEKLVEAGVN